MHLKSISIKGFKSFPERTRLVFSPGVSVIVGPNGCGKSNITDAVLWALGEQSPVAVRGQTMQDVIFAGGEGQSPRRYAEVEVVIDNSDGEVRTEFSELAIRRRLDRAGEGTYWLNGARCRLVDVVEALADANLGREMHSVISQGKVEEIVHSKPRDRRLLIEEAAGLGKHRKRRRRAELKLRRTEDNLDRALDVEREARSRLRPLKRQAQAAETHARLEGEGLELRARLLAGKLREHGGELVGAEREARSAREARAAVDARFAEVNRRRTEIEERLGARDRERTVAWGRLTALRAAHERLAVRAEGFASRRAELAARAERLRGMLGDLLTAPAPDDERGSQRMARELEAINEALGSASSAFERAVASAAEEERAAELGRVAGAAERAARGARRAETLISRSRQGTLERDAKAAEELLAAVSSLAEALEAAGEAIAERATAFERRVMGGDREADEITEELRACSREEADLQAELRAHAETVTEVEVRAAHLRDRHEETARELAAIGTRLGRELGPAADPLEEAEREEIERALERLVRRREQLGPVNPLAEREYTEAREHVEELETTRQDLESALAELEKVIRETDRKIEKAFEETFDAASRNFEELVSHLFPGGRGRLRLVDQPTGPRPVLGGAEAGDAEGVRPGSDPAAPGVADEKAGGSGSDERERAGDEQPDGIDSDEQPDGIGFEEAGGNDDVGVEIEVTPAGKATRRLSLLSGGEKSLVALAFVFAVFLARPSPFYILDEVEAALDDANIDRFLQLVRRFSDRAQFVIVTHQKRTMDAADVLYGVSMGEGGVTKVISRRMPDESDGPARLDAAAEEQAA